MDSVAHSKEANLSRESAPSIFFVLSWELALDEEIDNEIETSFNVIESIKKVETKLDSGLDLDLIRKV